MILSSSRLAAIAVLSGLMTAGLASSVIAQSTPLTSVEVDENFELVDESVPSAEPESFQLEPRQLEFKTEGLPGLSRLAEQINLGVGGDGEEFLPDGMVIRGSNGSLQVGGEL